MKLLAITNSDNYVLENAIAHETNDKAVRKGVSLILYGLEEKTKGKKWNEDEGEEEKTTIYDMDVTEEIDYTVDKCPECGGADVDVKHECKMVIDTPKIVKATKKRIKSSKGKCKNNNHKINTMPKGYTKGSMFGPNLMTMSKRSGLIIDDHKQARQHGSINDITENNPESSVSR